MKYPKEKLTNAEIKELRINFLFGHVDEVPKPLHILAKLEARRLWRKWIQDTIQDPWEWDIICVDNNQGGHINIEDDVWESYVRKKYNIPDWMIKE